MNPDSPQAIEQEILRLSGLLDLATSKIANRARKSAETDVTYKVAFAQATLKAHHNASDQPKKPTVAEIEAYATVECQQEYRDKRNAEATLLSAQEASRNIRSQLDALRSLAANQRFLLERSA